MSKCEREDTIIALNPAPADRLYAAARMGLQLVPLVGGAASELFTSLVAPPLERRRDEFLVSVYNRLVELEAKTPSIAVDAVLSSDRFVTAVTIATRHAIATTDKLKLRLLRNAVVSYSTSVLPEDGDVILMNVAGELTGSHVAILAFVADLDNYLKMHDVPSSPRGYHWLDRLLKAEFGTEADYLFRPCIRDLVTHQLLDDSPYDKGIEGQGIADMLRAGDFAVGWISDLGRAFLSFVRFSDEAEHALDDSVHR